MNSFLCCTGSQWRSSRIMADIRSHFSKNFVISLAATFKADCSELMICKKVSLLNKYLYNLLCLRWIHRVCIECHTLPPSDVIDNVVTHDLDLLYEGKRFESKMFGKFIRDFVAYWRLPVLNTQ